MSDCFFLTTILLFFKFPQVPVEFFRLQAAGRLRRRWSLSAVKVFISAELEPSPLTAPDFTLAALPYLPRALPPLASAPCPSLWSCLAWLSTSPVWPAATSHPSPPCAPRLPRSHSSRRGRGAPGDGPQRLAIQNANQALCGTSHDFPPRHEPLFIYWFYCNRTLVVTLLLSGSWSATLDVAERLSVILPVIIHFFGPLDKNTLAVMCQKAKKENP